MTLLRSCTKMLDFTNLLNLPCFVALFEAKILLLLLINNELNFMLQGGMVRVKFFL